MNGSRPAGPTTTHRTRRAESEKSAQEIREGIIKMLDVIEHKTVLRMVREIVHWLAAHQDDLV